MIQYSISIFSSKHAIHNFVKEVTLKEKDCTQTMYPYNYPAKCGRCVTL